MLSQAALGAPGAPGAEADGRAATWLRLGPVAFLVHDLEELVTVVPWLRAHGDVLPAFARRFAHDVTTAQFGAAVAVLLALFLLLTWHGLSALRRGRVPWLALLADATLVANALTHVGQAGYVRGYTPGLLTAVVLVLPYGFGLGRAMVRSGRLTWRGWGALVALGLALQGPLAALALLAGRG